MLMRKIPPTSSSVAEDSHVEKVRRRNVRRLQTSAARRAAGLSLPRILTNYRPSLGRRTPCVFGHLHINLFSNANLGDYTYKTLLMPIFSPLSLLQIAGGLLICVQQLSSRRFDVAVRRYSSFCRSAQNSTAHMISKSVSPKAQMHECLDTCILLPLKCVDE